MSDSSCARQRARSAIIMVSEFLFPRSRNRKYEIWLRKDSRQANLHVFFENLGGLYQTHGLLGKIEGLAQTCHKTITVTVATEQ